MMRLSTGSRFSSGLSYHPSSESSYAPSAPPPSESSHVVSTTFFTMSARGRGRKRDKLINILSAPFRARRTPSPQSTPPTILPVAPQPSGTSETTASAYAPASTSATAPTSPPPPQSTPPTIPLVAPQPSGTSETAASAYTPASTPAILPTSPSPPAQATQSWWSVHRDEIVSGVRLVLGFAKEALNGLPVGAGAAVSAADKFLESVQVRRQHCWRLR
jgi:hypothetical protein